MIVTDILLDGTVRAAYVSSLSSQTAPTTADLNTGILLTQYLILAGLVGFEAATATADSTPLAGVTNTGQPGRDAYSGTQLILKKQSGTDTPYNTLTRGTTGFIVVRRWNALESVAWTSGQQVAIYPGTCGTEITVANSSGSEIAKYGIPWIISGAVNLRAIIA